MKLLLTAVLSVSVASGAMVLSALNASRDNATDSEGTLAGQPSGHASQLDSGRVSAHAAGFNVLPASFRGAWAVKHPADDAASW